MFALLSTAMVMYVGVRAQVHLHHIGLDNESLREMASMCLILMSLEIPIQSRVKLFLHSTTKITLQFGTLRIFLGPSKTLLVKGKTQQDIPPLDENLMYDIVVDRNLSKCSFLIIYQHGCLQNVVMY